MTFKKVILYKVSGVNTITTKRVSGPPCGEAPARSSLVPRDLTAELCLIALASLGHVCLAAFFISFCWAAFCVLSFAVVFSVVGSLYRFRFSLVCFCWAFCIARAGASPSGTR